MSDYAPPRGNVVPIGINDTSTPLPPLRGTGYLAGTVTDDGAPVVATIRALWRKPGGSMLESVIAGKTESASNGTWQISDINPALEYTVVAGMAGRNDVLAINVTPRNTPRFSASTVSVPIGVALDYAPPVIGGEGAVTVALDSGTLPSGVTYASGKLTGSWPTGAVDEYPVVFALTDDNETVTETLTIDLILLPLTIHATTAVPAILVVGDAMTPVTFAAAGGEGPYTYAVATGALPTGTSIDSATGVWSGTPSVGDGFDFSVKAVDARSTVETTESYHVDAVVVITPDLDTNVALHKSVSVSGAIIIGSPALLVDGSTSTDPYLGLSGSRTTVEIDLGDMYRLDQVKVWHYWGDSRTYHGTKTEVSADGVAWYVIYDSAVSGEYAESATGKTNDFSARPVRYIRDYINGSNKNTDSHWVEIQAYRRA